jgi:hypothetical protein
MTNYVIRIASVPLLQIALSMQQTNVFDCVVATLRPWHDMVNVGYLDLDRGKSQGAGRTYSTLLVKKIFDYSFGPRSAFGNIVYNAHQLDQLLEQLGVFLNYWPILDGGFRG